MFKIPRTRQEIVQFTIKYSASDDLFVELADSSNMMINDRHQLITQLFDWAIEVAQCEPHHVRCEQDGTLIVSIYVYNVCIIKVSVLSEVYPKLKGILDD